MENRSYISYGGQTGTGVFQGQEQEVFVFPMKTLLNESVLTLIFEAWSSTESFDCYGATVDAFRRDFCLIETDLQAVKGTHEGFFEILETEVLDFLEVSPEDYTFESISIDTSTKRMSVSAKHRTKPERRVTENIITTENFDAALASHPQLVVAYFKFVWSVGKVSDEFLASLQPID
jgi:hypothetical protein